MSTPVVSTPITTSYSSASATASSAEEVSEQAIAELMSMGLERIAEYLLSVSAYQCVMTFSGHAVSENQGVH